MTGIGGHRLEAWKGRVRCGLTAHPHWRTALLPLPMTNCQISPAITIPDCAPETILKANFTCTASAACAASALYLINAALPSQASENLEAKEGLNPPHCPRGSHHALSVSFGMSAFPHNRFPILHWFLFMAAVLYRRRTRITGIHEMRLLRVYRSVRNPWYDTRDVSKDWA